MRLLFLFFCIALGRGDFPAGHMQALGSHQPREGFITDLVDMPSSNHFHADFILESHPVIIRGALTGSTPVEKWTDDYLRLHHGDAVLQVDPTKKEDRNTNARYRLLSSFLGDYNTSEWYLIDTLPSSMQEEFPLPSCLACGGFTDRLQDFGFWFSSGNTKSSFHFDTVENLNCQIAGEKKWFFINKTVSGLHEAIDHMEGDFSSVNVDAVDMIAFPQFQDAAWWSAVTLPGDCVYVPYKWFHYVESRQRNLAVNIWWTPFDEFKLEDCEEPAGNLTLNDFQFTPGTQVRFFIADMVKRNGGKMSFDDIHPLLIHEHTAKRLLDEKGFSALDLDKDGFLTEIEINQVGINVFEKHVKAPPGEINTYGASKATDDEEDEEEDDKDEKEPERGLTHDDL